MFKVRSFNEPVWVAWDLRLPTHLKMSDHLPKLLNGLLLVNDGVLRGIKTMLQLAYLVLAHVHLLPEFMFSFHGELLLLLTKFPELLLQSEDKQKRKKELEEDENIGRKQKGLAPSWQLTYKIICLLL